jgi:hypothetical protein
VTVAVHPLSARSPLVRETSTRVGHETPLRGGPVASGLAHGLAYRT